MYLSEELRESSGNPLEEIRAFSKKDYIHNKCTQMKIFIYDSNIYTENIIKWIKFALTIKKLPYTILKEICIFKIKIMETLMETLNT